MKNVLKNVLLLFVFCLSIFGLASCDRYSDVETPDDNQGDTGTSSIGNNMNLDEIYQSLSPDVGE